MRYLPPNAHESPHSGANLTRLCGFVQVASASNIINVVHSQWVTADPAIESPDRSQRAQMRVNPGLVQQSTKF